MHVLAGEVADGVVVLGVAKAAGQDDSWVSGGLLDFGGADGGYPVDDLLGFGCRRGRHGLGGHFLRFEPLGQEGPTGEVVGDHVHIGVGLEVELGGGHFAAVAGHAVFADKGFYGLVELLVDVWGLGWRRPPGGPWKGRGRGKGSETS